MERRVNRQIFFMFIALIVLSLVSTVGSSIRSVSLSRSRLPFLSKGRLELTLNGISRFQWVFSSKQWYLAGDISSNKGSSILSSSKALRSLTRRIFRFLLVRFNSQAVHRGFVSFSRLQLERYFSLTIYVFFVSADILTFIILYNNLIPISFVQSLFLLLSLVSFFFRPAHASLCLFAGSSSPWKSSSTNKLNLSTRISICSFLSRSSFLLPSLFEANLVLLSFTRPAGITLKRTPRLSVEPPLSSKNSVRSSTFFRTRRGR